MFTQSIYFRCLKVITILLIIPVLLNGCDKIGQPVSNPTPPKTEIITSQLSADEVARELKSLSIDSFFEESFIALLKREPETLTVWGLTKHFGLRNDRLNNLSDSYLRETQKLESAILELLRKYDRESLTPDQRLNYDVYEWYLDNQVRGHRFMYHDYEIHHFLNSYHINLNALFTRIHPLDNGDDVEDYISRLAQVEDQVAQLIGTLATREEMGVIPPKFIAELTRDDLLDYLQIEYAEQQSDIDPLSLQVYVRLHEALDEMDEISPEEKGNFLTAAQTQIEASFIPAYVRMLDYQNHLISISTEAAGVWKLPDGEAYYAHMLRQETTTDLTPQEVHEIGLAEVARLHDEILVALIDLGYSEEHGLAAMMQQAVMDFGFYDIATQAGRDEIVQDSEAYVAEMEARMSEISDLRLAVDLVVKGDYVPEFFHSGGLPGGRPSYFFVAWLGDKYPKYIVPTIAYHEAIPGHYYQDAIMKGMNLPLLRYAGSYVAYNEGWALYAEQLAWEMGMYDDNPYGNVGRLQGELLRAVRLVADTGIHAMGWTREEAQAYVDEATLVPGENTYEVDRYIVMPAQATGYKIGMLKILELRQKAMDELGDMFDLKEFHNIVLSNGDLPLEILVRVVDDYIDAQMSEEQL